MTFTRNTEIGSARSGRKVEQGDKYQEAPHVEDKSIAAVLLPHTPSEADTQIVFGKIVFPLSLVGD